MSLAVVGLSNFIEHKYRTAFRSRSLLRISLVVFCRLDYTVTVINCFFFRFLSNSFFDMVLFYITFAFFSLIKNFNLKIFSE